MKKTKFGSKGGSGNTTSSVQVLYNDAARREQFVRFMALQVQACLDEARLLRAEIVKQLEQLDPDERPDSPSEVLIALMLGLFRTGAQLKVNAITAVELSIKDIAAIVHYGVSQVKVAMAWLGCGEIKRRKRVVAHGLGVISVETRFGKIRRDGIVKAAYRTSVRCLSDVGRQLLGLLVAATLPECAKHNDERARKQRRERRGEHQRSAIRKVRQSIHVFLGLDRPSEPEPHESNAVRCEAELGFMSFVTRFPNGMA